MVEETKVLFIPGYYKGTEQKWVNRYLAGVRAIFEQINVHCIETSPLSDLNSVAEIKTQIKKNEGGVIVLCLITWLDPNVVVDLLINLPEQPIIIWSTDYIIAEGKKVHLGQFAAFLPIKGSLEQVRVKFAYIYGNPNRNGLASELRDMVVAANAVVRLKRARIGFVGYTALGMYPGMFNPLQIKELLGVEIVPIDNHTLIDVYKCMLKDSSLSQKVTFFRRDFDVAESVCEEDENSCVAMTEAIRQLIGQYELSAITLKCLFELSTDIGCAPCVPLTILTDKCVVSCESDIPVTLSQLILHYLTTKPTAYVDIIMMEEFRIYCSCCGFGAFKYAHNKCRHIAYATADKCKTEFGLTYNRLVNNWRYEDGIYSLARLKFADGEKCCLQVISGENKEFDTFYELGCTEFPSMGLVVKQNTSRLLDKLGSQHFALIQGDMVNKLKHFCKIMDIDMEIFS